MTCYRNGGCGPYEMLPCNECPASKPEYRHKYDTNNARKVVKVVQCKDCVNWQTDWKPRSVKDGTHFCAMVDLFTDGEWYCADGEPREVAHETVD